MPDVIDNYKATPVYNGGAGMTPAQVFAASGNGSAFQMAAPSSGGASSGGGTAGPSSTTKTSGSSTTNSSSDQTTNTHESQSQNTHTTVKNMDDASLAALDKLIAQLQGGGTSEMLADRALRLKAIADAQKQQQGYSKEAAMADARGAMDAETARALNQILPSLTRSAEGAGTSRNSMRALMTQNAASDAAMGASQIGLKAATEYGQVSNGISSILTQLVAMKDPAADALLQALSISKGAVQNTDSTVTNIRDLVSNVHTQGTSTTNSNQTSNTTNTLPASASGLASMPQMSSSGFSSGSAPPRQGAAPAFNPNEMMSSFGPAQRDLSPFAGSVNGFGLGTPPPSYADSLMGY